MDGETIARAIAGGALIGAASVWLLAMNGRIAGISGIFNGLLRPGAGDIAWRMMFVGGLVAAGLLYLALGNPAVSTASGPGIGWLVLAGLLVGYGTRMGSGCTSGHGVCGLGRRSARSLVAVVVFLATGVGTTFVTRHLLGVGA